MWMVVCLQKRLDMQMQKQHNSLTMAFVNPPHADWSLANNVTYLLCQSHYQRNGRYADRVKWLPAPYKFNRYETFKEVYQEIAQADVIMFSSYAWNYTICDEIAKIAQAQGKITILGGPHIGTNEPEFLATRIYYDYICRPTKPGETFIEDFINSYFDNQGQARKADISWELHSERERAYLIDYDYSVYEDHLPYLREMVEYAKSQRIEPFIVLESTRGCPYSCVFCEWGGGIGTKIYKKSEAVVKRDILALKAAGFRDAYLTDANFGVFEQRDIELFKFAWQNKFNLTDISTVKSRDLTRRKRLVDAWFDVVGRGPERHSASQGGTDMWGETEFISVVPTVSIQSVSDEAMKVASRVDLSLQDKIELSRHINQRCREQGFPTPAVELILAMPGSTIDDFYTEFEIMYNFQARSTIGNNSGWSSFRHDYMFLPDSELNSDVYKIKYKIETVEVYSDIVDEDGVDNWHSLYKNKRTYFKTIRSCYSFTREEMLEMWFMNQAGPYVLEHFFDPLKEYTTPKECARIAYKVIQQLDDYGPIHDMIADIFNPDTEPRSIRKLGNRFRVLVIEEMLNANKPLIMNGVMNHVLQH